MDVGQNASLGDGHTAEELVKLFVVADGQLEVAGGDAGLLVVAGGVASELKKHNKMEFRDSVERLKERPRGSQRSGTP